MILECDSSRVFYCILVNLSRLIFHDTVPNAQASNVRAQPFNSTACLITWEPVEDTREAVNGKLGGYRVRPHLSKFVGLHFTDRWFFKVPLWSAVVTIQFNSTQLHKIPLFCTIIKGTYVFGDIAVTIVNEALCFVHTKWKQMQLFSLIFDITQCE